MPDDACGPRGDSAPVWVPIHRNTDKAQMCGAGSIHVMKQAIFQLDKGATEMQQAKSEICETVKSIRAIIDVATKQSPRDITKP